MINLHSLGLGLATLAILGWCLSLIDTPKHKRYKDGGIWLSGLLAVIAVIFIVW